MTAPSKLANPMAGATAQRGLAIVTPYDIASAASPSVPPADAHVEQTLAVAGIAVCFGVVAVVWLAGALYKVLRSPQPAIGAPPERPPAQRGLMMANARLIGLTAVCVIFADIRVPPSTATRSPS